MILHIAIDSNDLPSPSAIKGAIDRLNKDIDIIKKYGGPIKKECSVDDLVKACMFLEILSQRLKKHFPKQ